MRSLWILTAILCPQLLFAAAEEVKASHILVRTQDEADLVRNEIVEKGGDRKAFMEAARKHSKDVTTKRAGGALGWFTRPKMVPDFSAAAFDLKVGEISLPVKTQYGYHLILLEDRREQPGFTPPTPPVTPPGTDKKPTTLPPAHPVIPAAAAAATTAAAATPPAATPPTPAAPPAGTPGAAAAAAAAAIPVIPPPPAKPIEVKPVDLKPTALKLVIEIKEKIRPPDQAVEVELLLINFGKEDLKVCSPDLLPLGFNLAGEMAPQAPPATWDALKAKKIETPIVTLPSRRSIGATFSLNDYFKDLPASGRYRLSWKPQVFLANVAASFPEIAALPDFSALKAIISDPGTFQRDVAGVPDRLRARNIDSEVVFSIFDPIQSAAGKKLYAVIELDRQPQPIWVELFADRQPEGVRQFARLAQTGFYDGLTLFDIQKGNYIRGGSPTNNDFGGPEQFQSVPAGASKVSHEAGTISMVSRTTRVGKEIGSIFFISRKAHPEWDAEHLPIGKIISGDDVLAKVEAMPTRPQPIRKINIVGADKLPADLASAAATPEAKAVVPPAGRITPTAKIKTAKGEFTVELFEDDAPRTVSNFVDLADSGYFNTKPEMAIYYAVPGTLLLTGSPSNDPEGNPGWRIPDETSENKKTHTKGTLSMCLEMDPLSKNPVPGTAGSQFMICLQDMPAWNGLYTPFGKITEGQEIADKLGQGDKIESITITNKRNHPYRAPGRPAGPPGTGALTPFPSAPGSTGALSPSSAPK